MCLISNFRAAMLSILKYSRYLIYISLLVAASCSQSYKITQHTPGSVKVKDVSPDSNLNNLIKPYKDQLDVKMSELIGRADTTLTKKQPESTLGNFMADAQLMVAREIDQTVSISVANYGGIRISYLTGGDIRLRNMYELMPFDNKLVIIEVSGTLLHQLCDHMAALGGWPVSGMSYIIKDKKAINILVGDKQLNEQTTYKVAISDYVANGGDNCDFLKTARQHATDILIRDALIGYVRSFSAQNKPLHSSLENRVQHAQ